MLNKFNCFLIPTKFFYKKITFDKLPTIRLGQGFYEVCVCEFYHILKMLHAEMHYWPMFHGNEAEMQYSKGFADNIQ